MFCYERPSPIRAERGVARVALNVGSVHRTRKRNLRNLYNLTCIYHGFDDWSRSDHVVQPEGVKRISSTYIAITSCSV